MTQQVAIRPCQFIQRSIDIEQVIDEMITARRVSVFRMAMPREVQGDHIEPVQQRSKWDERGRIVQPAVQAKYTRCIFESPTQSGQAALPGIQLNFTLSVQGKCFLQGLEVRVGKHQPLGACVQEVNVYPGVFTGAFERYHRAFSKLGVHYSLPQFEGPVLVQKSY